MKTTMRKFEQMTSHVDTFDTRPRCIGGCRKVVTSAGMVCSSCMNSRPKPAPDPDVMDALRASLNQRYKKKGKR